MFYIEATVSAWKDDVQLFETDCECRIEYDIVDGMPDWDVTEFHFTDTKNGKPVYAKITRTEPLFHILYKDLDREWLQEKVIDACVDNGEMRRYA